MNNKVDYKYSNNMSSNLTPSRDLDDTGLLDYSQNQDQRPLNYSSLVSKEQRPSSITALSPSQAPPQSPSQRLLYVAQSPVRYIKKQIRPGGIKSSIFSLIILCLGAGTLSIPYVFYKNGIVVGTILLLLGAFVSMYTGWLVVICCHRLNAERYEDIARGTYGKKAAFITSICMLACLIGFVVSYIVLFKELMPFTIERLNGGPLPDIISQSTGGKIFWSAIFSFGLVFPVSLARTLSALRFSSFFSFVISIYIVFAIVFICLGSRTVNPDIGESFKVAFGNFDITAMGVFNSLPLIIFAYMYQTNIPMIYFELEKKNLKSMWKIMIIGTTAATFAYLLAGIFGYVAFATNPDVAELMEKQDILKCYPESLAANYISLFGILIVILFATPLTLLPCKDTVEELFLPAEKRMTSKQNVIATFTLVTVSFVLSMAIPNVGDAITILGATTNSGIGFLFPIIFYLRVERKAPKWSSKKLVAYFVFCMISLSSIIELGTFIYKKVSPP